MTTNDGTIGATNDGTSRIVKILARDKRFIGIEIPKADVVDAVVRISSDPRSVTLTLRLDAILLNHLHDTTQATMRDAESDLAFYAVCATELSEQLASDDLAVVDVGSEYTRALAERLGAFHRVLVDAVRAQAPGILLRCSEDRPGAEASDTEASGAESDRHE